MMGSGSKRVRCACLTGSRERETTIRPNSMQQMCAFTLHASGNLIDCGSIWACGRMSPFES